MTLVITSYDWCRPICWSYTIRHNKHASFYSTILCFETLVTFYLIQTPFGFTLSFVSQTSTIINRLYWCPYYHALLLPCRLRIIVVTSPRRSHRALLLPFHLPPTSSRYCLLLFLYLPLVISFTNHKVWVIALIVPHRLVAVYITIGWFTLSI